MGHGLGNSNILMLSSWFYNCSHVGYVRVYFFLRNTHWSHSDKGDWCLIFILKRLRKITNKQKERENGKVNGAKCKQLVCLGKDMY